MESQEVVPSLDPECHRWSGDPARHDGAAFPVGALRAVPALRRSRPADGTSPSHAFCILRPPGHHAERQHAMGFCFFNNIAIAAEYARSRHGLRRLAILA